MSTTPSRLRKHLTAILLVVARVSPAVASWANTVAANASDSTTSSSASSTAATGSATQRPAVDEIKSQRADEQLLTGTDAEKARAAALAKYPGATIQRVETDSDGVYEAHIVTASGQRLIVQMDKAFTVAGTDSHAGPGGHAGSGGSATGGGTTTG